MIITCERCATRFKVPDDKLAGGPVRMRCSKCNHVFLAGAAAVVDGAVPAASGLPAALPSLPPSFAATLPPSSSSSSVPAPVSGAVAVFGAPRAPSHDPFSSLGPPPARPDPFPFSSAPKAPSRPDPFAGLGSPSSPPMPSSPSSVPSSPDPFAGLSGPGTPAPFTPPPPPTTSRKVTHDPFAGLGLSAVVSTPPRAASKDPFAGIVASPAPVPMPVPPSSPGPAPFGAMPSSPPVDARPDPFASLPPSPAPPPPPATTQPDPFGSFGAPGVPRSDPFGAASVPRSDPFAAAMSQPPRPMADPFALMSQPPKPAVDPFAAVTSPPKAVPVDPFAEPAVADPFRAARAPTPAPPPPDDDEDPFGRLDDVGASYDADARSSLFGIAAPTPPTTPPGWGAPAPPSSAPSGLSLATPPPPAPAVTPTPVAVSRLIPVLRAALNVLQVLLFVVFVIVAVVVARGGSPMSLLNGDLGGALLPEDNIALRVDHLDIAWRTSDSGVALIVVTGTIHHGGDAPLPSIVVEASTDGTVTGKGFAWSDVDAFAVAAVKSAEDIAVLQARRPKSPRVAPGDDAPFVIVAPAPGISADIVVVARPGS